MKDYLVFQLYSPLASWGQEAVGEVRHTGTVPGRSALLGLIAAALGIDRDDELRLNALNQHYHFAIHARASQPRWLRDFHTVQVPRENKKYRYFTRREELTLAPDEVGTLISQREYRCDDYWHIAVSHTPEAPYSLDELRQALQQPHFPLYLGRKSCPLALPLAPRVLSGNLRQILNQAVVDLTPAELQTFLLDQGPCYWDDPEEDSMSWQQERTGYDRPISRQRWQFGRTVWYCGTLQGGE